MATATIKSQKRALRKIVSATLKSLSQSQIQLQCAHDFFREKENGVFQFKSTAKTVTDAVVNSAVFQTSKHISCYLSMPGGELDTGPLVSAILAAGPYRFSSQPETNSKSLHSRKGPLRPKAGHLALVSPEDGHASCV